MKLWHLRKEGNQTGSFSCLSNRIVVDGSGRVVSKGKRYLFFTKIKCIILHEVKGNNLLQLQPGFSEMEFAYFFNRPAMSR
jgi:hypothetical protein